MEINDFRGKNAFLTNMYDLRLVKYQLNFGNYIFYSSESLYHCFSLKSKSNAFLFHKIESRQAKIMIKSLPRRDDWHDIKDDVMRKILVMKFKNEILRNKLIETGNSFIKEGNHWHDNYWGDCYCSKCKNIDGLNKLGLFLMELRTTLIQNNNK